VETKLNPADRKIYYLSRFEDQRHLLRRAIQAMAEGDIPQALHVAVVIRVLMHKTRTQKPLLRCLRRDYWGLPIMERVEDPPEKLSPGQSAITFYCPISANISQADGHTKVGLRTDLDSPRYKSSPLGAWWGHRCMVLPGIGPVIRSQLILDLADKEGAHVDPRISEGYQKILGNGFIRFQINGEDAPLNISRLVVGKCGVELLDCLDRAFPANSDHAARVSA
jgi:hypothetical protein